VQHSFGELARLILFLPTQIPHNFFGVVENELYNKLQLTAIAF
jgi:hypothetical protein